MHPSWHMVLRMSQHILAAHDQGSEESQGSPGSAGLPLGSFLLTPILWQRLVYFRFLSIACLSLTSLWEWRALECELSTRESELVVTPLGKSFSYLIIQFVSLTGLIHPYNFRARGFLEFIWLRWMKQPRSKRIGIGVMAKNAQCQYSVSADLKYSPYLGLGCLLLLTPQKSTSLLSHVPYIKNNSGCFNILSNLF